jgi:hypothetical protein
VLKIQNIRERSGAFSDIPRYLCENDTITRKFNTFAIIMALVLTSSLSSCGQSKIEMGGQTNEQAEVFKVPTDCNQQVVIDTFNKSVPGSRYVPTEWQPSPGTDLAAATDAGGIACTYGIQTAEVGATILWAPDKDGLWDQQAELWSDTTYDKFDIPGINEDDAYILRDDVTGADGAQIWQINLLISGVWIQIGASFIQTMEEATPFIQASINALRK